MEEEKIPAGISHTVYPEEKLTLAEWYAYIGKLILEDRNKKQENERHIPKEEN